MQAAIPELAGYSLDVVGRYSAVARACSLGRGALESRSTREARLAAQPVGAAAGRAAGQDEWSDLLIRARRAIALATAHAGAVVRTAPVVVRAQVLTGFAAPIAPGRRANGVCAGAAGRRTVTADREVDGVAAQTAAAVDVLAGAAGAVRDAGAVLAAMVAARDAGAVDALFTGGTVRQAGTALRLGHAAAVDTLAGLAVVAAEAAIVRVGFDVLALPVAAGKIAAVVAADAAVVGVGVNLGAFAVAANPASGALDAAAAAVERIGVQVVAEAGAVGFASRATGTV